MNEIMNQIDELKLMQQFPRYFLSKYFEELKTQVDTKYALKLDKKDKYLEIINNIESFEQDAYNKWSSKGINTYDDEIKLIEDKLKNNYVFDFTKQIGEVKYKIEKIIFNVFGSITLILLRLKLIVFKLTKPLNVFGSISLI
jgi:hypothetical protein